MDPDDIRGWIAVHITGKGGGGSKLNLNAGYLVPELRSV